MVRVQPDVSLPQSLKRDVTLELAAVTLSERKQLAKSTYQSYWGVGVEPTEVRAKLVDAGRLARFSSVDIEQSGGSLPLDERFWSAAQSAFSDLEARDDQPDFFLWVAVAVPLEFQQQPVDQWGTWHAEFPLVANWLPKSFVKSKPHVVDITGEIRGGGLNLEVPDIALPEPRGWFD